MLTATLLLLSTSQHSTYVLEVSCEPMFCSLKKLLAGCRKSSLLSSQQSRWVSPAMPTYFLGHFWLFAPLENSSQPLKCPTASSSAPASPCGTTLRKVDVLDSQSLRNAQGMRFQKNIWIWWLGGRWRILKRWVPIPLLYAQSFCSPTKAYISVILQIFASNSNLMSNHICFWAPPFCLPHFHSQVGLLPFFFSEKVCHVALDK